MVTGWRHFLGNFNEELLTRIPDGVVVEKNGRMWQIRANAPDIVQMERLLAETSNMLGFTNIDVNKIVDPGFSA